MISYWRKFGFAFKGIKLAFSSQINLKIQLLFAVSALIAGFALSISRIEWLIIIFCITLVLAAEIFNSALEAMVDLVSPDRNELAGRIKDISAGAVLVCAGGSAVMGAIVFMPKLLQILKDM